MMICKILSTLIVIAQLSVVTAQDYDTNIGASFKGYETALLSHSAEKLAESYPPSLLASYGGIEFLIEELKADFSMYQNIGLTVKGIETHTISRVLDSEENLQAIIPYMITYGQDEVATIENSFLFTISYDGGEKWYFVDMKKYDAESIAVFIPEYDKRLNAFLQIQD